MTIDPWAYALALRHYKWHGTTWFDGQMWGWRRLEVAASDFYGSITFDWRRANGVGQ